jgi:hypothetical protein
MFLIYINEIGVDFKGQYQYEFLFSTTKDITQDDWLDYPSMGKPTPPDIKYLSKIGVLKNTDIVMELIQKSNDMGIIDAIEGIVALGWEKYDIDKADEGFRLSFHYGETIESINEKLENKGIELIYEDIEI